MAETLKLPWTALGMNPNVTGYPAAILDCNEAAVCLYTSRHLADFIVQTVNHKLSVRLYEALREFDKEAEGKE